MRLPTPGTLRTKFLLALALISALLTSAVLLIVRYRVQLHVRSEITESLQGSVGTFESLQRQRESTLEQSAALLAALPPLKAVMTSGDPLTIQDASTTFWQLAGSELMVLVDRDERIVALHTRVSDFPTAVVERSVRRYVETGAATDWWYGQGHLFQVFLQPISVGGQGDERPVGMLAVGYEIDPTLVADLRRAAASDVAFVCDRTLVLSTVGDDKRPALAAFVAEPGGDGEPRDIRLGSERYITSSVRLSAPDSPAVTLTVLRSYDVATAFLRSLNQWIAGIGLAAVVGGGILVFLVSTTFTRPLARLVSGVKALEQGDFEYPLAPHGSDEVAALTSAFTTMRSHLSDTQRRLIDAEQFATIGRMASTISHDLRHPLTAIQAYAEFLVEGRLTEAQRRDCQEEIQSAVARMTGEIDSLLAFSKEGEALRPVDADACDTIERAIRTMKALPEFDGVSVLFPRGSRCRGRFDPAKLERVMLNLIINAAEACTDRPGEVVVTCRSDATGLEIRVADNGTGIPAAIAERIFQPFVTAGKQKGIGLGLTVVHSIARQHGGAATLERTGPDGTVFTVSIPHQPHLSPARAEA